MLIGQDYVNIDFGHEEAAELKEEVDWLRNHATRLETVEYKHGVRFYVPDSLFKTWVEKFDIRTMKDEKLV